MASHMNEGPGTKLLNCVSCATFSLLVYLLSGPFAAAIPMYAENKAWHLKKIIRYQQRNKQKCKSIKHTQNQNKTGEKLVRKGCHQGNPRGRKVKQKSRWRVSPLTLFNRQHMFFLKEKTQQGFDCMVVSLI